MSSSIRTAWPGPRGGCTWWWRLRPGSSITSSTAVAHVGRAGSRGFFVPVFGGGVLGWLREVFTGRHKGAGARGHRWSDAESEELREALADVTYRHRDGFDETRIRCGWTRPGCGTSTRRGHR